MESDCIFNLAHDHFLSFYFENLLSERTFLKLMLHH